MNRVIVFLIIISIIIQPIISYAAPDNDSSSSIPNFDMNDPKNLNSQITSGLFYESENIYGEKNKDAPIQIYRDKYVLDTGEGFLWGYDPINSVANVLFEIQMNVVEIAIFVIGTAISKDFTTTLQPLLNSTTKNLWDGSMKHILMVILSLMCLFIAFQLIKIDKTKVVLSIVSMVLIVALSYYYFQNTNVILKKANEISGWFSNELVISFSNDEEKDDMELETKMANSIWDQFVHTPWQMMMFFSVQIAESDHVFEDNLNENGKEMTNEEEILAHFPEDPDRAEKYKEIMKQKSLEGLGIKRIAFMIVYFIPMVVSLGVIMILALMSIGYQFYLLLVIFMGIFVLPIAFHPDQGIKILKSWGLKIIGAAGMKIVLVFIINFFLALNNTFFSAKDQDGNELGWFTILLLQLIVYIVIFVKRKDLYSIFGMVNSSIQNSNLMMGKFRNLSFPSAKKFKNDSIDAKNTVSNFGNIVGKGSKKVRQGIVSSHRNIKETAEANAEYGRNRHAYESKNEGKKPEDFYSYDEEKGFGFYKDDDIDLDSYVWKIKGLDKEKYSEKSLSPHKERASEYLRKKYNREKGSADKKVKNTEYLPKYNDFIKKADSRKYRKEKMFTDEQVNDVAKRYEKVKRYQKLKNVTESVRKKHKKEVEVNEENKVQEVIDSNKERLRDIEEKKEQEKRVKKLMDLNKKRMRDRDKGSD